MKCSYCLDVADTLDHVIPVSYQTIKKGTNRDVNKKSCVPACRECNNVLNNKFYHTVSSRASYIYDTYLKKYKKLLSMSNWTKEELEDMGYNLRQSIEASLEHKKAIEYRLNHLKYISELCLTVQDAWDISEGM